MSEQRTSGKLTRLLTGSDSAGVDCGLVCACAVAGTRRHHCRAGNKAVGRNQQGFCNCGRARHHWHVAERARASGAATGALCRAAVSCAEHLAARPTRRENEIRIAAHAARRSLANPCTAGGLCFFGGYRDSSRKRSYINEQSSHAAWLCYFATLRDWLNGWRAKLGGVAGELRALALAEELDLAALLGLARTSASRCRAAVLRGRTHLEAFGLGAAG